MDESTRPAFGWRQRLAGLPWLLSWVAAAVGIIEAWSHDVFVCRYFHMGWLTYLSLFVVAAYCLTVHLILRAHPLPDRSQSTA